MSDEILDSSAARIAEAVGAGRVSAVEVTQAFLDRIEAVNPVINAVCTQNPEALDAARAVDRRRADGEAPRPPGGGAVPGEGYSPDQGAAHDLRLAVAGE